MLITQDTKAREEIQTVKGVMLGMDWLQAECQRIKAKSSWRDPQIVKVRNGYAIDDNAIKRVFTEHRVPKIVKSDTKLNKQTSIWWSEAETQMLIELYAQGVAVSEIAKRCSRSVAGCYWRLRQVGVERDRLKR
jgi:hypothetical protein